MVYGDDTILYYPSEHYTLAHDAGRKPDFTGAKIYSGILVLFFHNNKITMNIGSILAIWHQRSLLPKRNLLVFVIRNGDKTIKLGFSEYIYDVITFQSLMAKLIELNPNITLHKYITGKLQSTYERSKKLHFDLKVHKPGQPDHYIVNPLVLRLRALWVYLLLIAFCLLGMPYIGGITLRSVFGGVFDFYRLELWAAAGCVLAVAVMNLFLALRSRYKGHGLTFGCVMLAVAAVVISLL